MNKANTPEPSFSVRLERPIAGFDGGAGRALARVVEAHPTLADLLDFVQVDPLEIALAVGMVSPHEEDGIDDLGEIDFGPAEWFEPAAGLAVVRRGLGHVQASPESIAAAIYDPAVTPEAVRADLEALERALLFAQQQETRFHFVQEQTGGAGEV